MTKTLEKKVTTVVSAVKHLFPVSILESGKEVSSSDLQVDLDLMSHYVQSNAQRLWALHSQKIEAEVAAFGTKKILFKQRFLRYNCAADTTLPRQKGILTGNLREIIEHKILSESETWIRNPNPYKQPFSFNSNVDLSATNDQLSVIQFSESENVAILQLRCMDKHYILTFQLPAYLRNRKIKKISKPRVRQVSKGNYCFDFTTYEEVFQKAGNLKAGIDLGKIEPYVAVVTTTDDRLTAQYYSSAGLKRGWEKYKRLVELTSQLYAKAAAYDRLGLDASTLLAERKLVLSKKQRLHAELSKRQAHEIASKFAAHNISTVNVENLKWLSGDKGVKGRGGKWSYARQQVDLAHALARGGSKTKTVSPKNSSQKCWKCSDVISHRKRRSVWCENCKTDLDRDFNAAMNIATLNHLRKKQIVSFCGANDNICTAKAEVIAGDSQPEINKVHLVQLH